MTIRATITTQFEQVATEQQKTLAVLTDDLELTDCGLDSLSFALMVTRLEDALGVDPFNSGQASSIPATFGEFVRLYERSAG